MTLTINDFTIGQTVYRIDANYKIVPSTIEAVAIYGISTWGLWFSFNSINNFKHPSQIFTSFDLVNKYISYKILEKKLHDHIDNLSPSDLIILSNELLGI